jgi:hypothetical protein
MILVKLRGGLSNQMFQYAAARRLADHHRTELRVDISWYAHPPPEATPRAYELHHLNISATLATADDLIGTDGVRNTRLPDLPIALWRKLRPRFRFVAESQFQFDERILSLPDNVCLFGYWVSERYFADIEPAIRQEFSFREAPDDENARLMALMQATPSVSLHVRRGDYAQNPTLTRIHGICSLEYYSDAIGHITQRVPGARFFVFSDDLAWAEQHLLIRHPIEFVRHNAGHKGHEDLRLMSNCRHHIIANSGFSWWGAWLNPRPDKIICAPARWFADGRYDTSDVLPPSWVRL